MKEIKITLIIVKILIKEDMVMNYINYYEKWILDIVII